MSIPLAALLLSLPLAPADSAPAALANDNRVPAGLHVGDTLVLKLPCASRCGCREEDRASVKCRIQRR